MPGRWRSFRLRQPLSYTGGDSTRRLRFTACSRGVSFPDNPELLRTPRNFAARALDGELDADQISAELSNLLGFTKNFYLQFLALACGLTIRDLDRDARRTVRPIERRLRASKESTATLRLISHFVTVVEFLESDDGTLYDEMTTADRRRRILQDLGELLDRIGNWADERDDLPRLTSRAEEVTAAFASAVEIVDFELGYDEDEDG